MLRRALRGTGIAEPLTVARPRRAAGEADASLRQDGNRERAYAEPGQRMDSRTAHEALTWATLKTSEDGTLVMIVGELPGPLRFAGDPTTAAATSDTFGGTWFGAQPGRRAGASASGLVELGDAAGAIAT